MTEDDDDARPRTIDTARVYELDAPCPVCGVLLVVPLTLSTVATCRAGSQLSILRTGAGLLTTRPDDAP